MQRCLLLLCALTACGTPSYVPTETTVQGSVAGVHFDHPVALFSSTPQTLWFGAATGVNDATVLVTDAQGDVCAHVNDLLPHGPSSVPSADGGRLPSLLIGFDGQSDLKSHRRTFPTDLHATFDPGATAECAAFLGKGADGGVCPSLLTPTAGTAFVYETDSTQDDKPSHARARFDLSFGADHIEGTILADPCQRVSFSHCSTTGFGAAFVLAALCAPLMLKRRAWHLPKRTRQRVSASRSKTGSASSRSTARTS